MSRAAVAGFRQNLRLPDNPALYAAAVPRLPSTSGLLQ